MDTSLSQLDLNTISAEISLCFPTQYGSYLFGSAAAAELRLESDLDIALLCPEEPSSESILNFKSFISQKFRRDVDVVDLYRADSVTAAQIVSAGISLTNNNPLKMAEFETMALSRYALLNEERNEILNDIQLTGTIYER